MLSAINSDMPILESTTSKFGESSRQIYRLLKPPVKLSCLPSEHNIHIHPTQSEPGHHPSPPKDNPVSLTQGDDKWSGGAILDHNQSSPLAVGGDPSPLKFSRTMDDTSWIIRNV